MLTLYQSDKCSRPPHKNLTPNSSANNYVINHNHKIFTFGTKYTHIFTHIHLCIYSLYETSQLLYQLQIYIDIFNNTKHVALWSYFTCRIVPVRKYEPTKSHYKRPRKYREPLCTIRFEIPPFTLKTHYKYIQIS